METLDDLCWYGTQWGLCHFFLLVLGCAAHGFQLVLGDVFSKDTLVQQAMRAVDRVLRVFQRNPALSDWLLAMQSVEEGSRPHKYVRF